MCRALARDVIDYDLTPAGGSKMSRGTLTLPKRSRVIVGVDDTDTKDEGATWALVNNIAAMVDNNTLRYVSHAIVQLYPVKAKTKNCVATVVEFASSNANKPIKNFSRTFRGLHAFRSNRHGCFELIWREKPLKLRRRRALG